MKLATISTALLATLATAAPLTERAAKKTFFILAGDSTTAKQVPGHGGGWGAGFLNRTLSSQASGINMGHNGASTVTFVQMGDWGRVLDQVKAHAQDYNVFTTIQFGHNDQAKLKLPIADYKTNIGNMADDVVKAGGNPIIVSSIARRTFNSHGVLTDLLKPYADAALQVAADKKVRSINLWQASTNYIKAIGPSASFRLNLDAGDFTHLNDNGSILFGRMVADLMLNGYQNDFATTFVPNKTLSSAIAQGKPVF